MEKYNSILRECPLFRDIDPKDLHTMLHCLGAKTETFDKKYTVLAEGSPAKHIGIVLSGSLQATQVDYYGNRTIVSNIEPGELFAESFACAEVRALPISIIANELSEVMLIDSDHILHTCQNNCGFHQQLIFNLMKGLATKNIQFHQKIGITSKRSTREKLLAYLDLQSKKTGSRNFDIPFDRQALADYLEVERSGLSAEIGKLKREGILRCTRNHFELL